MSIVGFTGFDSGAFSRVCVVDNALWTHGISHPSSMCFSKVTQCWTDLNSFGKDQLSPKDHTTAIRPGCWSRRFRTMECNQWLCDAKYSAVRVIRFWRWRDFQLLGTRTFAPFAGIRAFRESWEDEIWMVRKNYVMLYCDYITTCRWAIHASVEAVCCSAR